MHIQSVEWPEHQGFNIHPQWDHIHCRIFKVCSTTGVAIYYCELYVAGKFVTVRTLIVVSAETIKTRDSFNFQNALIPTQVTKL